MVDLSKLFKPTEQSLAIANKWLAERALVKTNDRSRDWFQPIIWLGSISPFYIFRYDQQLEVMGKYNLSPYSILDGCLIYKFLNSTISHAKMAFFNANILVFYSNNGMTRNLICFPFSYRIHIWYKLNLVIWFNQCYTWDFQKLFSNRLHVVYCGISVPQYASYHLFGELKY